MLCNVENAQVVVVPASEFVQGETNARGVKDACAGKGVRLVHDKGTNTLFVSEDVKARLQTVAGFTCPKYVAALVPEDAPVDGVKQDVAAAVCGAPSHRNVNGLRTHVREEHGSIFCDVCVSSRIEYKSMLPIYPLDTPGNGKKSAKLHEHVRKEHPACRFCGTHFLDDDELFSHLQKNHEACHICERAGRLHEYFRSFSTLEAHYRSQHFVCDDPACRGVVFASVLDLQAHMLSRHRHELPRNARGRRLQVDLAELHAPVVPPGGGRGGRGGRGGGRGGRGGGVAVHGVRHGPDTGESERAGPAPALMSDEDVRLEQERQAARRREFQASEVVFSSDEPSDGGEAAGSGGDIGVGASGSGSRGGSRTTNSGRQVRASNGGAGRAGVESSQRASATSEQANPDDGGFHERAHPASPEELSSRNKALVTRMRAALDPAEFEQFRTFSGDFRNQRMSAEEYYNATVECFGVRSAVRDVLPELTALLPNVVIRAELTKVCLRRNPPPFNAVGAQSSGASHHGGGGAPASGPTPQQRPSMQPPSTSVDIFPTLSGGSAAPTTIRPSAPRMRGALPKAGDFPRLGKAGPSAAPAQRSQPSGASMQPSMDRVFGGDGSSAASAGSGREATKRPTPSAAKPAPDLAASTFPSLSSGPANGTASNAARAPRPSGPPPSVQRHASQDFPSLSGPSSVQPSPALPPSSMNSSNNGSLAPAADVSDRAGAVWGGATTGRGGKKRGPGRGSIPAPLPEGYAPQPVRSGPIPTASRPANSASGAGQSNGGGGAKVIDVTALSLSKQAKSALPRVSAGGSFGFAWERKKVRSKQREIRRELHGKASTSAGPGVDAPLSSGFRPELAPDSELSVSSVKTNGVDAEPREDGFSSEGTKEDAGDTHTEAFDQFSYLNVGNRDQNGDADPSSSFFGS